MRVAIAGVIGVLMFGSPLAFAQSEEQRSVRAGKISMHEHFRVNGNMEAYVQVMEAVGIEKAIFVPTGGSPDSRGYQEHSRALAEAAGRYPGKIYWFATTWSQDPEAVSRLEEQVALGARGIKFIDWLIGFDGAELDGPKMRAIYQLAETRKLPMLLHIDFQKHPEWGLAVGRAAEEFPAVTFVIAHYCRAASEAVPDLALCGRILDEHPNIYADISMGGGIKRYMRYIDQDPGVFRDFILRYQDKLMWGTDMILDGKEEKTARWMTRRIMQDMSIFMSSIYLSPFYRKDDAVHQGLDLPPEVLDKVLYHNPLRILAEVFR